MLSGADPKENKYEYEVIQQGSKSWTGEIRLFSTHGRRKNWESVKAGNWAVGDSIQLKSCFEAGILLLLSFI